MSFFLDRFGAAPSSGANVAAASGPNNRAAVSERVKLKDYQIAELKRCEYWYTHEEIICWLSSALVVISIESHLFYFVSSIGTQNHENMYAIHA